MQLYYIRHGQSKNNLLYAQAGAYTGRQVDPPLTAVGKQQAHSVAEFLRDAGAGGAENDLQNVHGFGITHVYTSLMLRAVATGSAIAQALSLPLLGWADIHETGGMFLEDPKTGALVGQPGMTRTYLATHYLEMQLPDSLTEAGWWNRPFESREVRPARGARVWRELLARHGDSQDRVVLVSHGGFFNYLLAAIVRFPLENHPWFYMNNAAIARIDFTAEKTSVIYLNRLDFLPARLIT